MMCCTTDVEGRDKHFGTRSRVVWSSENRMYLRIFAFFVSFRAFKEKAGALVVELGGGATCFPCENLELGINFFVVK